MGEQSQGESLGQYRLTECRAEGPVARVCKAVDRTNGQRVLVRILDAVAGRQPQLRAALEALRNPNHPRRMQDPRVLRLLDVGTRGDSYFLVYEDFAGVGLDEYVQVRRPDPRERLRIARGIAEALAALHAGGLLHGDLKPQNVLVARDEHGKPAVKLALADLAVRPGDAMVSVYGELVGTPKYLAPEVILGHPATNAADLFALGVILYELFSGHEPFPSSSPLGYLHANAHNDAPPLSASDPTTPPEMGRVVERLLARDMRHRYRSAQAVLDDLDRVEALFDGSRPALPAAGADSAWTTTGAAPEMTAMSRDGAWRAAAIVALAAVAVLLTVFLIMQMYPRRQDSETALRPPTSTLPPPAPTPVPPPPDAANPAKEFSELQRRARELAQTGRYDEIIRMFREFRARVDQQPLNQFAFEEMAAAALAKAERSTAERPTEAVAALRAVVAEYKGTPAAEDAAKRIPELLLERVRYHEGRGEIEQAIGLIETMTAEFRDSPQAAEAARRLPNLRVRLANALRSTHPDRALALLREAAENKVSETDAAEARKEAAEMLIARSDASFRDSRYQQALADLAEALKMDGAVRSRVIQKEPEALLRLALQYKETGQPGAAVATFKQLQEKYPAKAARIQIEMAPLIEAAGAAAPASDGQKPAPSDINTLDAAILRGMAEKELNAGNIDAARPLLDRIIAAHKGTPQAAWAVNVLADRDAAAVSAALQAGNMADARQAMEKLVAAYPGTRAAAACAAELSRIKAAPKGMVYVPAGEFTMGLSAEQAKALVAQFRVPATMAGRWFGSQMPSHRVPVSAFYIDQCEVTNAEYKAFVDATRRAPPPSPDWVDGAVKAGAARRPVTMVTWEDAAAYAAWAGKLLPTEAQWEKAARGTDGRLFPWGNTFDPNKGILGVPDARGTQDVGILPDGRSPYGCYDMIGNVSEWTRDAFKPYPDTNPDNAAYDDAQRVARGAGWNEITDCFCLVTTRFNHPPATRGPALGFRCVKEIE